jgi:FlaA1/EpsC-like NDP-sugar epimerase
MHESLLARVAGAEATRTAAAIVLDVLVVVAAYAVALLLRFDADVPHQNAELVAKVVLALAFGYVAANWMFGVYRTIWAYGSLGDIIALFRPVLLVTIVIFGVNFWVRDRDLPLSVVLIAGGLIFPGMAVVKMRTRLLVRMPWASVASRRLLIIGAGHTGQLLARELQNTPNLNYQPIGFLDDDPRKLRSRIHGLRVLGTVDDLPAVLRNYDVEIATIAIPGAPGAMIRQIVAACQSADIPVRLVRGV